MVLLPVAAWATAIWIGLPAPVAVGTLVVMGVAVLAGLSSSISAVARQERFGWAAVVATILVPAIWFALLVLWIITLRARIALP